MDARISELEKRYLQGALNRRRFLERLSALLGSYTLAHHYLEASGFASALSRRESQRSNIRTEDVTYGSGGFSIQASLSRPGREGAPGVIVIHENRGLNDHTRDVARRLAVEGFAGLAPDLLSRQGGTAATESPDHARELMRGVADEAALEDLLAAHRFLSSRGSARVGVVGFCWGGARSFLLATADEDLSACVVFYGTTPFDRLQSVHCPVLGLYGERDTRITSRVEETARALQEHGKSYQYHIYPGAQHAFFNDTRAGRYDAAAARDAWSRTIAFFRTHLGN